MVENNQLPDNHSASVGSQIPMVWRIVIAGIAAVAIIGLLWQFIRNPADEAIPPTTEAVSVENTGSNLIADENSPEELFQMGNSYYQSGALEQAVTAYKKAIELNPKYDAAYANLGAVYYAQQNLDQAEEAYLKAIELSPNDADVLYNLGAIYLQQALTTGIPDQEKVNRGLVQINKAIELNPKLAEPYYGLGVAYQLQGSNDLAITAFEKFLEFDTGSDPTATQNATQILDALKSQQ